MYNAMAMDIKWFEVPNWVVKLNNRLYMTNF